MNQLNVNLPELPYAVSEAMNRLRINIKFCGKNTRKILLTSCQPNEGKSTISSSYNQVFFIENSRFFNLSYLSE